MLSAQYQFFLFISFLLAILIALFFPLNSNMPSLAAVRASNAAFSPSKPPVALFVGGTSGIGQAMAEAFARYTKGNVHIVIIGRTRASAESIIANLPKPTVPDVTHEFVQCDVALMKNVQAVTTELLTRIPKINFLVMSPGMMTLKGREETEEGIDKKLAVHYYARWKFTNDLMPALLKAKDAGEDAKVFSVLAAGKGREIDLDDLGLKKKYSISAAALVAPTYNDLMMEVHLNDPFSSFTSITSLFSLIRNLPHSTRTLHSPMPPPALSVPHTPQTLWFSRRCTHSCMAYCIQ